MWWVGVWRSYRTGIHQVRLCRRSLCVCHSTKLAKTHPAGIVSHSHSERSRARSRPARRRRRRRSSAPRGVRRVSTSRVSPRFGGRGAPPARSRRASHRAPPGAGAPPVLPEASSPPYRPLYQESRRPSDPRPLGARPAQEEGGSRSSIRLPSGSMTQPNFPNSFSSTFSSTSHPLAMSCARIASRSRTSMLTMKGFSLGSK